MLVGTNMYKMEQKWAFQHQSKIGIISDVKNNDRLPTLHLRTDLEAQKRERENINPVSVFVRYTQETSFGGLKYIGENGNLLRR